MKSFAEQLLSAYRSGTRVVPEGDLPASMTEALAVQAALCAELGPVAGFKAGLKPEGPPIMAARCFASGAHVGSCLAGGGNLMAA